MARLTIAAAAGFGAAFVWFFVGFLTGVVGMCVTASDEWVRTYLVLLVAIPLAAAWTTWRLLGSAAGGFAPMEAPTDGAAEG
jgi:hypothetical protein